MGPRALQLGASRIFSCIQSMEQHGIFCYYQYRNRFRYPSFKIELISFTIFTASKSSRVQGEDKRTLEKLSDDWTKKEKIGNEIECFCYLS